MHSIKCTRALTPAMCGSPAPNVPSTKRTHKQDLHGSKKRIFLRLLRRIAYAAALVTGAAMAQSPVAYVYVAEDYPLGSVTSPITAYAASSTGQLTPIPGSPFTQTSGTISGTNGTYFITEDQNSATTHQYLHVYDIASNGAIGNQVSSQDLHEWCGMVWGAELDHTGQYVYVMDDQSCGENYQSFALSKSGQLTFLGALVENGDVSLPVFSGNDKFAYTQTNAEDSQEPCPTFTLMGLGRESSGALESINISETDPTPPPGYQMSQVGGEGLVTDDPTDHLATLVQWANGPCGGGSSYGSGLASYTVESNGDLVSTNFYGSMPQLAGSLSLGFVAMELNPAGNILAVPVETGIQFFHFNGAAPITTFTGVIGTSGYITAMAWDSSNHLYALNGQSGKLHVYTVTSTGVVEAPGSPYLPPDGSCRSGGCWPQYLIVRSVPPATCSAPSSNGVNVCSPGNGATVSSPVSINAAAMVSGGVYRFSLWNGDTKLLNERDSGVMDGSVSLAPGMYKLIFDAENASGTHVYATRDITVK
jgi:hypothetical protein